jgi:hypothetical protein
MADLFLKIKEIEKLFWKATTIMLGFDPANPVNANKVRISWPVDGAPAWKITEDVTFLRIGDEEDPFSLLRDTTYSTLDNDNANQETSYTRVMNVHWVCYGPNSNDSAFMIRNKLYSQIVRDLLNDKQVFLVPKIDSPIRSPELFNGQWWDRSNLNAKFNLPVVFDTTVPYLKSATVQVTDQNSNTVIVDIKEN